MIHFYPQTLRLIEYLVFNMECKKYTHFDEILGVNQKVQCKFLGFSTQKKTLVGAVITVIGMIVVIILVTDTSKDPSKINSGKIGMIGFDLKIDRLYKSYQSYVIKSPP